MKKIKERERGVEKVNGKKMEKRKRKKRNPKPCGEDARKEEEKGKRE